MFIDDNNRNYKTEDCVRVVKSANIFKHIDESGNDLVSVIYNAGNNNAKPFLEMDLKFFQELEHIKVSGLQYHQTWLFKLQLS